MDKKVKIYLASDHAGYELKQQVKEYLAKMDQEVIDLGTDSSESVNWAMYGARAAAKVSSDPEYSRGIIICGSGIGMSIVSNKFPNVRAALCHDEYTAEMARRHNNANVLNMGARVIDYPKAKKIIDLFLKTPFDGGRHADRLDFLKEKIEKENFKAKS